MGKTKTAFVGGVQEETLSGAEKYKLKQQKKAQEDTKEKHHEKKEDMVHISGLKGGQRIKMMEQEPIISPTPQVEEKEEKLKDSKVNKKVSLRGKKYLNAKSKIDKTKSYKPDEVIKLVKETSFSKFDGSVEVHIVTKNKGMTIRTELPHTTGKQKKVVVANDSVIEELSKGKINFDLLLSTPDMMPKLIPFAKLLGPKGLMPNPKNGTIIKSEKDKENLSGNSLTLKTEKDFPLIHTVIGKVSQKDIELIENLKAIIKSIEIKNIRKCFVKATMGPSIRVNL